MRSGFRVRALCAGVSVFLSLAGSSSAVPQLELVSQSVPELRPDTAQGSSVTSGFEFDFIYAEPPRVSPDGRWVVFTSDAPNLVAGLVDANRASDVFLHDRSAGVTILVSRAAGTTTTAANQASFEPSLSADGRYVAFLSQATNLVPGQVDQAPGSFSEGKDVFLFDRVAGTMTLVSRQAGTAATAASGEGGDPVVSADGRRVAFLSTATNLVGGQVDNPQTVDLFLYDRVAGTTALVSHRSGAPATAGGSGAFALSGNGEWIAFLSAANDLVPGQADGNFGFDLFLYEATSGAVTLVTHASGSPTTTGNAANDQTDIPSISADGRRIAFVSQASDLVAGVTDTKFLHDVFLFDRIAGTTTLLSAASATPTITEGGVMPVVSRDGTRVAFVSGEPLIPGQTSPSFADVYLYEVASGALTLVSRSSSNPARGGNDGSWTPALSGDGTKVIFRSQATDLVAGQTDVDQTQDLFLFDQASGTLALVNHVSGSSATPAPVPNDASDPFEAPFLADDGHVLFTSGSEVLVSGAQRDGNRRRDVFFYDPATGTNRALSVHDPSLPPVTGNDESIPAAMSGDGRFLAFTSRATDLVFGQDDRNGEGNDVFLQDRLTGEILLVSHVTGIPPMTGEQESLLAGISRDGDSVVFSSASPDLVGGSDTNSMTDLFLFDRPTRSIALLSIAAGAPGTAANGSSSGKAISANGRFIAFSSTATNLVAGLTDDNSSPDVFLHDTFNLASSLISHAAGAPGVTANNGSIVEGISADGRFVLFSSLATNLIAGQVEGNNTYDVFLYDRISATTTLVSRAAGQPGTTANDGSFLPEISANGRFVAFASGASNLVPGQTGGGSNVFLFDRTAGTTALVSHASGSLVAPGAGSSSDPSIDDNGDFVVFTSHAPNLVPGQIDLVPHPLDPFEDVFLYDRRSAATTLVSHAAGSPLTAANNSILGRISGDGTQIVFRSNAPNLVTGQPLSGFDAYKYHRLRGTTTLLSPATSPSNPPPFGPSGSFPGEPAISQGGQFVAFGSEAWSLVAQDYNGALDTFRSSDPTPAADLFIVQPCRRLDTRQPGQGPALTSGAPRFVPFKGFCDVPDTASAVVVNVTITQSSGAGFLTAFPGDFVVLPLASTMTFEGLQTRTNNAIVPLAPDGTLALQAFVAAGGTVHVIVDVAGYYE